MRIIFLTIANEDVVFVDLYYTWHIANMILQNHQYGTQIYIKIRPKFNFKQFYFLLPKIPGYIVA
jgi:hypothetical protein